MSEKKMVGKSVTIALGMACICLLAGLAGIFAYYIPLLNDRARGARASEKNLAFTIATF